MAALDPMHDNPLKELTGWPDLETAPSVVRCIKQSRTFSNPAATPWDLHLIQWPWMTEQVFCQPVRTNNLLLLNQIGLGGNTWTTGGLNGYITAAGADLNLARSPDGAQLTLADSYSSGPSRLLGVGIEVNNTTADIYKQGQIFTWRLPEPHIEPNNFLFLGNIAGGPAGADTSMRFDGQMVMCPPLNSASAMLIPGTRQWRAEDGTYIVVAHVGQENPPSYVDYVQPLMRLSQVSDTTFGVGNGTVLPPLGTNYENSSPVGMPVPHVDTATHIHYPPFRMYPIHLCGCILTGLSPQSTLTVTWNVYLETFPNVADPDILVLATPSAEYDPIALQIYSHALTRLPVGVPSDWNGFGDWFADVVATVTDFITPGALALGMPAIAGVSAGAGKIAKNYLASNAANTKPVAPDVALKQKKALSQNLNLQNELAAARRQLAMANTRPKRPRVKPLPKKLTQKQLNKLQASGVL